MPENLVVNEIYLSVQGESTFAGLPCIFVRLTACNLRCSYCDTAYAFTQGKRRSFEEIRSEVERLAAPHAGHSVGDHRLPLVEFTGGEYPHNNMDCVLRGAEAMMKKHEPNRKFHWGGGNDDITKTYHPSLTCFLGLGWPFVIADDLAGTWDHGRVCVGAVVNHRGKVQHCYVLDPSRIEKLMVKADGTLEQIVRRWMPTYLPAGASAR